MLGDLSFIDRRRSVRRFTPVAVPEADVLEMVRAATRAPSGMNEQNWHFVVVASRSKIDEIASVVETRNARLAAQCSDPKVRDRLLASAASRTFFKNAPVLVLLYGAPYPASALLELETTGASKADIEAYLKSDPAVQNLGAAMENLLLAAANMGYGGCWVNSAVRIAGREISQCVGFEREGYFLAAMTPIGVPEEAELAGPPRPRKPMEEVVTVIR